MAHGFTEGRNQLLGDTCSYGKIHFNHGTSCKARMEDTPDGRGDSFLYGVVKNEVYMEQSLGFETHDRQSHVYRWKKALYGLKQVPRTWYGKI